MTFSDEIIFEEKDGNYFQLMTSATERIFFWCVQLHPTQEDDLCLDDSATS